MNSSEKFLLTVIYVIADLFCNSLAVAQSVPFLQCQSQRTTSIKTRVHQPEAALCHLLPFANGICISEALEDLKARDPLLAQGPSEIVIIENSRINAFLLDSGRIGITRGLLDTVWDHNDLKFVIAHELGHYRLAAHQRYGFGDMAKTNQLTGQDEELGADLYAVWLLSQSTERPASSLINQPLAPSEHTVKSIRSPALIALRGKNANQFSN